MTLATGVRVGLKDPTLGPIAAWGLAEKGVDGPVHRAVPEPGRGQRLFADSEADLERAPEPTAEEEIIVPELTPQPAMA